MTLEDLKERIEEISRHMPYGDCDKCIDKFALHIPPYELYEENILTSVCLRRLLRTIAALSNNEKTVADYIQAGHFNNITTLCGEVDTFKKILKMINEITEDENACSMQIE